MTRAQVSRKWPRAHAICDRCSMRFNHDELQWQFQWVGPRLQNLRLLVCPTCLDVPQEGLRTIVLPPDPVPIQNPRPERYELANNPNSPIGQAPIAALAGSNIGTLIGGGGTYAAFDGHLNKDFAASANLSVSIAGTNNWVGKQWGASPASSFIPTTIASTGLSLTATEFTATAPRDAAFLGAGATVYAFEGSSDGATWTTLASTLTTGAIAESITVSGLGGTAYQYHRFALLGDGTTPIAVAQLEINTDRGTTVL